MDITPIILAAGKGTRMLSVKPKALQKLAHFTFLEILLDKVSHISPKDVRVVVSEELLEMKEFKTLQLKYNFKCYVQKERLGTAHAVQHALSDDMADAAFILNVDAPLISVETMRVLISQFHDSESEILNIAFKAQDPRGYGRLVTEQDLLREIIEDRDLEGRQFELCNSGFYIAKSEALKNLLPQITPNEKSKEYYLTDIIKLANNKSHKVTYATISEEEAHGVNNKAHLHKAENIMQQTLRAKAIAAGVYMSAPQDVHLAYDTKFAYGVTIWPYVVIGRGVTLSEDVTIYSFCQIEGCTINRASSIGPFARIRPGTEVGEEVRIGNFVELKEVAIKSNSKIPHLSYVADAEIDARVNIGAGTIFCNYDGFRKNRVHIESDVFVGSNCALVAPLTIGHNSLIGAGSIVTEDVEPDTLCIARSKQTNYPQRATVIKEKLSNK